MSQYYPPYRSSRNNIKVELDLANYATKTDLNNMLMLNNMLNMLMLVVLQVRLI